MRCARDSIAGISRKPAKVLRIPMRVARRELGERCRSLELLGRASTSRDAIGPFDGRSADRSWTRLGERLTRDQSRVNRIVILRLSATLPPHPTLAESRMTLAGRVGEDRERGRGLNTSGMTSFRAVGACRSDFPRCLLAPFSQGGGGRCSLYTYNAN